MKNKFLLAIEALLLVGALIALLVINNSTIANALWIFAGLIAVIYLWRQ